MLIDHATQKQSFFRSLFSPCGMLFGRFVSNSPSKKYLCANRFRTYTDRVNSEAPCPSLN
jgi:hypothetical protein